MKRNTQAYKRSVYIMTILV